MCSGTILIELLGVNCVRYKCNLIIILIPEYLLLLGSHKHFISGSLIIQCFLPPTRKPLSFKYNSSNILNKVLPSLGHTEEVVCPNRVS